MPYRKKMRLLSPVFVDPTVVFGRCVPARSSSRPVIGVAGQIRKRVILQQIQSDRTDAAGGNNVAGKRRACVTAWTRRIRYSGRRIVNLDERSRCCGRLREITVTLKNGGNCVGNIVRSTVRNVFIIKKEKCPVLSVVKLRNIDRPANREAEFIMTNRVFPDSIPVVCPAIGVQNVVPEKFVGAAVKFVCATAAGGGENTSAWNVRIRPRSCW